MKTLPLILAAALCATAHAQHEHARRDAEHQRILSEMERARWEIERQRREIARIRRDVDCYHPVAPTPPRRPWFSPALERLPEVPTAPQPTMEDYARADEARRARSNAIFEKYWGDRR